MCVSDIPTINREFTVFQKSFHIKNVRKIALERIKKLQEESKDCEATATTTNGSNVEMSNINSNSNQDNNKDPLPINGTE